MASSLISDNARYGQLLVEPTRNGFNVVWPDGSYFMGPYKTAAAARSELTKFKKGI